jgi:hypothetical protein
MYPASALFQSTCSGSYKIAQNVLVFSEGVQVLPPAGQNIAIASAGGTVTVDTTQAVRRTMSITLLDPNGWLTPASASSPLSPFGNEMQLFSGITYTSGAVELIPLGIFAMTSVEPTFSGNNFTIAVQGSDRGYTVGLRTLTSPISFAAGISVASAMTTLIGGLMPNGAQLVMNSAAYSATMVATTLNMGDNPWTDAVQLAQNIGMQLYFDLYGNCQLQPVPDPTTVSASFGFNYGNGSMIQGAARNLTQQGDSGPISNDFYMIYEGTGTTASDNPPVQGRAFDNNPQSPMYIYGPFGDVPSFVYTSVLQTQTDADAAAQQLLSLSEGQADGLTLTTQPVPFLDGYDVVSVDIPKMYVNANYVIDALTIPIGLGQGSTLTLRKAVSGA